MEYLDHALKQDFHRTLHKGKLYNKKKAKHLHDKPASPRNIWHCKCDRCQMGKVHKHLRAQRVYTSDEKDIYFSYYDWYDYFGYDMEYYLDQEEMNWYLREMNLDHLCSDFDWQEFVPCTGVPETQSNLAEYEPMCTMCGKRDWCECF